MSKILIIDDDLAICRTLQLHFQSEGFEVELAHNVDDGIERANSFEPNIIILDICMPGRSGLEGIAELKKICPSVRIIMITAFHDMESTIAAMKEGADEYIHKPVDLDELESAIKSALACQKSAQNVGLELLSSANQKATGHVMVGSSRVMRDVYKTIGRVAASPASVLITGESGTGKELVARAIHQASNRANEPFVAINCAALVETLLESEMFGHRKGAFSGAVNHQEGKFQLAGKGTLFLDEVGELGLDIQAKLLRVLQEREFYPLGAAQPLKSKARIICATNRNLEEMISAQTFREDLFYRLQVVTLELPPLRDRLDDLDELVQALLMRANRELGCSINKVSTEVVKALHQSQWPGNIRELQNTLTKMVALCQGDTLTPELLPDHLQNSAYGDGTFDSGNQHPAEDVFSGRSASSYSMEDLKREHVSRVLDENGWHRGKVCDILGISRPRLQRMIVQYELESPVRVDVR
ncbi:sigma-54-dependent Fis family transcriptional regulator [Endozoicomonas sp. OPT23]|uniref:sigma-54-dependent transcriptional regulator n=1 Tax=Endozoicomonas sp. OPT23 TaxID=2072845 RepID=UPI00129B57FA|nr:sigma-54 dependent transcriptional regulator [Endozoicomonas sp. OPT23]MRI32059.1 sigma-54-dependent Fis family transcriptional regulator [Endozoicomonas sp. OPT23]